MIQQDFDNKYAITNLQFVKAMLEMPEDHFSAAEIAILPGEDEDEIKLGMTEILGNKYLVQTRYEQNRSLYSIMQVEKWVIYAVLSLILIVAAFNMIGALTMLVLEKKQDISVLHALGAGQSFIQRIFLSEGLLLAVIGGGAGMLLALSLALIQINFKVIPLQGGSFLIDYFPVKLALADFLLVGFTVLTIALVASWIPARKAARQQFALRSE
jgi:lipoprotein-releasing system permease protein